MADTPGSASAGDSQNPLFIAVREALGVGEFVQAERLCLQALAGGRDTRVMLLLGTVLARAGRLGHAAQVFSDVLKVEPQNAEALDWFATLLSQMGKVADAVRVAEYAVRLRSDEPSTQNTLGRCYLSQGRWSEAAGCFAKAIQLSPETPAFHHHHALAMQGMGNEKEMVLSFKRAIAVGPELPYSQAELGAYLLGKGKVLEALEYLEQAVAIVPSEANLVRLAKALAQAERFAEATEIIQRLVDSNPSSPTGHEMLGVRLQDDGRFAEALTSYERALAQNPQSVASLFGITRCRKMTAQDDGLLARMNELLADKSSSEEDRRYLHYALGKSFDDRGEYEQAMAHFDKANRLSQRLRTQRTSAKAEPVEGRGSLLRTFNADFLQQRSELGSPSETPVFIVGMIRSGTTLAEQILSSHGDVVAGGELSFWLDPPAVQVLRGLLRGAPVKDEVKALAADYERLLKKIGPDAQRVTDKMPINYPMLGLMHLLFPNAHIIHCRRNPVDTCLSIYMTPFGEGPSFAYDREQIVKAYREYLGVMEHWRTVLPADRLLEVDYEALVADRERVTREIVAFCGLPWDERCLHHEANERSVHTPSRWQARQPIYNTSVERWRRYEQWLGPLAQLIE